MGRSNLPPALSWLFSYTPGLQGRSEDPVGGSELRFVQILQGLSPCHAETELVSGGSGEARWILRTPALTNWLLSPDALRPPTSWGDFAPRVPEGITPALFANWAVHGKEFSKVKECRLAKCWLYGVPMGMLAAHADHVAIADGLSQLQQCPRWVFWANGLSHIGLNWKETRVSLPDRLMGIDILSSNSATYGGWSSLTESSIRSIMDGTIPGNPNVRHPIVPSPF